MDRMCRNETQKKNHIGTNSRHSLRKIKLGLYDRLFQPLGSYMQCSMLTSVSLHGLTPINAYNKL